MRRALRLLAALGALALVAGCVRPEMALSPDDTLAPKVTSAPSPSLTPSPKLTSTAAIGPTSTPMAYDALGAYITGSAHFERYIAFGNIEVYEQCGDTFMDAVAVNSYPEPIMCAADICFYQAGDEIASGKLQTRDGSYVLILAPGETTVFARIDTDMALTDMDFKLVFDQALGVMPDVTG